MYKKLLLPIFLITLFALQAMPVGAVLDTGLNYGTYTGLGTTDLRQGVMQIVNLLFGFLGVLAIAAIVIGGFLYMTAGGNEEKTGQGKNVITAGIIGLVIIFSAYAIASFVINQLISATGATTV